MKFKNSINDIDEIDMQSQVQDLAYEGKVEEAAELADQFQIVMHQEAIMADRSEYMDDELQISEKGDVDIQNYDDALDDNASENQYDGKKIAGIVEDIRKQINAKDHCYFAQDLISFTVLCFYSKNRRKFQISQEKQA